MGIFFDIQSGLDSTLHSISNPPKIQWENDATYKPVKGVRYWRPTLLPNRTDPATLDGSQVHTGIYQIDVFVPLEEGLATLMQDLDQIFDKFSVSDTITVGSTAINTVSVGRGRVEREKSWLHGFIEIQYKSYSY